MMFKASFHIFTITMIINYIIYKFTFLGFSAFIVNFFLLFLIKNNIFGDKIKYLVENMINKKYFFIKYFVVVFILISIVKYNIKIIYLDEVVVRAVVIGIEVDLTGDILSAFKVYYCLELSN